MAWLGLRTDQCGRVVGSAGTWEGRLFLAAVASIAASILTRRTGAGWIAAAAVAAADLAFLVALLGLRPTAYRREATVLLLVHALCTAVGPATALLPHFQLRRPRQAGSCRRAGSSCYCW